MKISEPILEAKANFVALHSFLKVYFSEGDKDFFTHGEYKFGDLRSEYLGVKFNLLREFENHELKILRFHYDNSTTIEIYKKEISDSRDLEKVVNIIKLLEEDSNFHYRRIIKNFDKFSEEIKLFNLKR